MNPRLLPLAFALAAASLGAAEGAPVRTAPQLLTAKGHDMTYFVSLPPGHDAKKTWPVLVVIPDAARDFEGNLAAFLREGGETPWIFVAPMVVTSGGSGYRAAESYRYSDAVWNRISREGDFKFDSDGLFAVLADVAERFGGDRRPFLTGWEAGGHTVWALLLQRPEAFRGVVPVSTNWRGRWVTPETFGKDPSRAKLPVRVLFCGKLAGAGEAGRQAWFEQTREVMDLAKSHGFGNITLQVLDGRPHGPLAADVLAVLSTLHPPR
ncbi:MAG: hypothetical protein JNK60_16830 [Acidobacteria bacterium]|nr:hypothetical protein [Acidobacteriota bacterium]